MRARSTPRPRRGKKLDLRKALFLLPNLATTASIYCGFLAVLVVAEGARPERFAQAAGLILVAMLLDTIDGRLARLTRTQSAFGVQLDSLADVVSFGVAPGLLVVAWALEPLGLAGIAAGFLYVAAGAIRLARFNVLSTDVAGAPKKPGKYVLGLPIPGAAGLLVALVVLDRALDGALAALPELILAIVVGLAALMVSSLRFRSFKELRPTPPSVAFVVAVVAVAVLLGLRVHASAALAWLLAVYVALALVESTLRLVRRGAGRERESVAPPPRADAGERAAPHRAAIEAEGEAR